MVRKSYKDDFKNAVVSRYYAEKITITQLSKNTGVSPPTLSRWIKENKPVENEEKRTRPWKIVQGIHQGGTDKKKRYWIVPIKLRTRKLHVGDEAVVYTKQGLGRIKITWVTNTFDSYLRYTDSKGEKHKFKIHEKVVMFYDD